MGEREGTAEDFAALAAALRGKREANRQIVEALHPPESEPDEDAVEEQEIMARLLAPKPAHVELIRRLHGTEDE